MITVGGTGSVEASRNSSGGIHIQGVCLIMDGKVYVHDNTGPGLEIKP